MKTKNSRRSRQITCVLALVALILYIISIVAAWMQGDITQAMPLAAIFLVIEGAPIFEILSEFVSLALFIAAGWLFFSHLSAFKKERSE